VIYVNEKQLEQVEYLIQQSVNGNHVLFSADEVRRVFETNSEVSTGESYQVEHHIEKIMEQPTLTQKRIYIETLDSGTLDLVIRTYFNIVENSIFEKIASQDLPKNEKNNGKCKDAAKSIRESLH
jgi:hypothetical protein